MFPVHGLRICHEQTLRAGDASQRHPALDNAFFSPEFGRRRRLGEEGYLQAATGVRVSPYCSFQQCHIGMGAAIALGISDAVGLICSPGLEVPARAPSSCGLGVYQFDHLVVRLDKLSPWTC